MAIDPMMDVAIIFSGLNSLLLIALLAVYVRIAIRRRAVQSIGLSFFALLLLGNSLLTVYSYVTMAAFFGTGLLPYLSAISVLEFAGLAIFLKITL